MFIITKIANSASNLPITILSTTIILIAVTDTFLLPKLTTRFCFNSPEPSRVSSQCVLCNFFTFDSTVMGCTGTTALSVNITASQAFCLISQCLGQIRQTATFLGRKRRSILDDGDNIDIQQLDVDSMIKSQLPDDDLLINEKSELLNDENDLIQTIEYNADGIKQQFTIKKDVEATIVDLIPLDGD